MFFTKIGKLIAHFAFWLGVIRVAIGFFIAFGSENLEQNAFFAQRYLSASTTGRAINEGMLGILIAVSLGVLCEISGRIKSEKTQ